MTTSKSFNMLRTAAVLALLSFGAVNVFAQATATGTILGTVFDQSQGVVGGAEVDITAKATGERRTAHPTPSETIASISFAAGAYSVKISTGFARRVENVDLLVGQPSP